MLRRVAVALAMIVAVPCAAQESSPARTQADASTPRLTGRANDVLAVLKGLRPASEVFASTFLSLVSAAQLQQVTAQLTAAHGALIAVDQVTPTSPYTANIAMRFEKATGRGVLTLSPDAPHLVTGLVLQSFEVAGDTSDKVRADLLALPGTVNAWFGPVDSGEPVLALNADRPLALGSTFKLYVLAALARSVAEGEHRWDEVVPLTARSYPSGVMQNWPPNSPVTLQTLATLMLQISDNTATDQLIALLGRSAIEAELRRTNREPAKSLPFMTTREMFLIKSDPDLRTRYQQAGEAERRQLLGTLAGKTAPLATVAATFGGAPLAIDTIEWFASPESLRRLMQTLDDPQFETARSLLTANQNLDEQAASRWNYVGYKGGSEPGVLNLTWLLQDKAGRWHMLTLGWNNPAAPVDTAVLDALAKRLLALPAP